MVLGLRIQGGEQICDVFKRKIPNRFAHSKEDARGKPSDGGKLRGGAK